MITEAQFQANEDKVLADIAQEIADSGLSIYEIAKGCGLSWDTVKAAACAVPVNFSSLARIRYYIKEKQHGRIL